MYSLIMNYQNGKIYKILNYVNNDVYVGSTVNSLCKKMSQHRMNVNNSKKDYAIYASMREHGIDNFYIELIEQCPCNTKEELRAKEGQYIRSIGTLNKRIECRSRQEYKDTHKEEAEQHMNDNKERIRQLKKSSLW